MGVHSDQSGKLPYVMPTPPPDIPEDPDKNEVFLRGAANKARRSAPKTLNSFGKTVANGDTLPDKRETYAKAGAVLVEGRDIIGRFIDWILYA